MIGKLVGWLRRRPETAPIPDALWQRLLATLPFLGALGETEQIRLRVAPPPALEGSGAAPSDPGEGPPTP